MTTDELIPSHAPAPCPHGRPRQRARLAGVWLTACALLALLGVVGLVQPGYAQTTPPCVAGPHSGTITSDQRWCVADSPHSLAGDTTIRAGTTVIIEPGVRVEADQGLVSDLRLTVDGTLRAQATANQPIVIGPASSAPEPGNWFGIVFSATSRDSILEQAVVGYGTRNIVVETSSLTITDSVLRYGDFSGITINAGAPLIRNTTFTENAGPSIVLASEGRPRLENLTVNDAQNYVDVGGGTLSTDYSWGGGGIDTYQLRGDLTIGPTATLTIQPGVRLLARALLTPDLRVDVRGSLQARGTASRPIVMTSASAEPAPGKWGGIWFRAESRDNRLDYVTVEYAGPNIIAQTSSLTISNSTLRRSSGEGLRVEAAAPVVRTTTFAENGGPSIRLSALTDLPVLEGLTSDDTENYIEIFDPINLSTDQTLGGSGIDTYQLTSNLTVGPTSTLVIAPGTTITLRGNRLNDPLIRIAGSLQARGTADQPIVFRSSSSTPERGDWTGLEFTPSSRNSIVEYATVAHGAVNVLAASSSLVISKSNILSATIGIRIEDAQPMILFNAIEGNTSSGITNLNPSRRALAACNWWGDASGPTHSDNPEGSGQPVSDGITFGPWLPTRDSRVCAFAFTYIDVTAAEPIAAEDSNRAGSFVVQRTGDLSATHTISYTLGGTAVPGSDYAALTGAVTLLTGTTSITLPVIPLQDSVEEISETVSIALDFGANYLLAREPATAMVRVFDTDPDPIVEGPAPLYLPLIWRP